MLNSVSNALRALEYLVEHREVGVSELARALEVSPGGAHRLLTTLAEAHFADQNADNRKYRAGSRIFELANAMRDQVDFLDLAHSHLERLMSRSEETVNLGVLRGDDVVYVDRVASNQPLSVEVKVGSRVPAYCTALGKTLLAHALPEVQESYLNRLPEITKASSHHVPTRKQLDQELARAVRRGNAEDIGEFSPDIACIAAPVLNSHQRAVAAVSVSGPASRIKGSREKLFPLVEIAGKELSLLLQELGDDSPRL